MYTIMYKNAKLYAHYSDKKSTNETFLFIAQLKQVTIIYHYIFLHNQAIIS